MIKSTKNRNELIKHYKKVRKNIIQIWKFKKEKQVKIIFQNGKVETLHAESDSQLDKFYRTFRREVMNIKIGKRVGNYD